MSYGPQKNIDRINLVTRAWETLRPTKTFAGLTLAQFKTKVKPSLDARTSMESLDHQMTAAADQRDDADAVSMDTVKLVVAAVKGIRPRPRRASCTRRWASCARASARAA